MVSRADVTRLASLNQGVAALVIRDLNAFWSSLDLSRPEAARDEMLRVVPVLVRRYGDIAATIASDWYSQMRVQAGVRSTFRPVLAGNVEPIKVDQSIRRAAGALFTDRPDGTLATVLATMTKYALEPGRHTVGRSSRLDPARPRVARVPTGPTTCSFCLMLASRGPRYWSLESAGRNEKFHPYDDCQTVVVFPDDALPEGYDPAALYQEYLAAREVEHAH